jgi:N-acetylglucosamine-6-phosphate deacetylase
MNGVFLALGSDGFGSYRIEDGFWHRTDETATQILTPGFVDLHIHGAFGIDFMSASSAQMLELCEKLTGQGYESFLPTTVTASPSDVRSALSNIPDHPMIAGFHLEGPFISGKFPGAQPPSLILDYQGNESDWQDILTDPRLKVITMAPERPGGAELAHSLNTRGVRVSMGHTDATFEQAEQGFQNGVRYSTHTFNAMRPLHHREAGAVGFCLAEDEMYTEIIYDRTHVCKDAAKVLFKCKPNDKVIAVSDSTMASGMEPGTEISMWNMDCIVGEKEIRLKSNDALAGSAITLKDAFQNLAEDFGVETAIRCCCHNPRVALGMIHQPKTHLIWDSNWELVNRVEGALV